uniref:Uncharacterized protein n=1 Tax=Cannabis sativa TaxID=3483 RepID=A0A803NQ57_CANSA
MPPPQANETPLAAAAPTQGVPLGATVAPSQEVPTSTGFSPMVASPSGLALSSLPPLTAVVALPAMPSVFLVAPPFGQPRHPFLFDDFGLYQRTNASHNIYPKKFVEEEAKTKNHEHGSLNAKFVKLEAESKVMTDNHTATMDKLESENDMDFSFMGEILGDFQEHCRKAQAIATTIEVTAAEAKEKGEEVTSEPAPES